MSRLLAGANEITNNGTFGRRRAGPTPERSFIAVQTQGKI